MKKYDRRQNLTTLFFGLAKNIVLDAILSWELGIDALLRYLWPCHGHA